VEQKSLDTWCLTTLRSCHVRTALFCIIMLQVAVISYRHFGTAILEGFWNPEDVTGRLSQKVVKNCHYLLYNDPEESSSYLLCGGSLKLHLSCQVTFFATLYLKALHSSNIFLVTTSTISIKRQHGKIQGFDIGNWHSLPPSMYKPLLQKPFPCRYVHLFEHF